MRSFLIVGPVPLVKKTAGMRKMRRMAEVGLFGCWLRADSDRMIPDTNGMSQ
jgi:hypothetical protein